MVRNDNTALYAFQKFGDTVLRAAFACCGSYSEAEDITQDTFLLLHAKPQSFTDDEHLKAWLLRVAVNKCKNLRRSFRFSRTDSLETQDYSSASYEMNTEDNSVLSEIRSLPEKYALVIYLYYYEGYNTREIAEIQGKSENTVCSLLRRGREKLKMELEKEGAI
ncbi:RNA polymerase sigma-70 factor, ECF subfamily [Ruminococcus sp. YRD2003]|uniref:RNA polymerase sigma factor n=1 Tax=Ruminococcus sp. YRD2003 TaxID=1452313 RepID=UPI0008C5A3EF|nr:RNA polymerase sigma-70 factor, ECF subfamily [Ruminococcus flavefaciens]